MINIPPIKPSTVYKSELINKVSETWKVGQVLNATAERGGDALSKILIRLGEYTLEAKTPVTLKEGQEIKLLVKSLGDNSLGKLPLLSRLPPQKSQPMDTSAFASNKLRQFIAIQESFSKTQQLIQTFLSDKSLAAKLPPDLNSSLMSAQNTLKISADTLSGNQLKQLILNSGIFLESKLSALHANQSAKSAIESSILNDFKYNLLSVKSALSTTGAIPQAITNQPPAQLTAALFSQLQQVFLSNNSPSLIANTLISSLPRSIVDQLLTFIASPEPKPAITKELQTLVTLLASTLQQKSSGANNLNEIQAQLSTKLMLLDLAQQVDRSISQLTSFQLQPLSREPDNLTLLLFNLVFKDKDEMSDMHFRIQQESKKNDPTKDSWQITLNFNFKTLGKVQSFIHLTDEQISTIFHTELVSTSEKIKSLLPVLETNLKSAGFNVSNLFVKPAPMQDKLDIHMHTHLLDENI